VVGEVEGIEMMGVLIAGRGGVGSRLVGLEKCTTCAFVRLFTTTAGPPCWTWILTEGHAAHPRGGYSCYIYDRQTRGADRAGADARGEQVACRWSEFFFLFFS
jgi:hypothetical protein